MSCHDISAIGSDVCVVSFLAAHLVVEDPSFTWILTDPKDLEATAVEIGRLLRLESGSFSWKGDV